MRIFTKLGLPRLGQAEQHMAHVFRDKGLHEEALAMYKQSVHTFERTGTSRFDTEHACSLATVAQCLWDAGGDIPQSAIVAYSRAAVVSCEAITGPEHAEARYYRELLVSVLRFVNRD